MVSATPEFGLLFEQCPTPYLVLAPDRDFTILAVTDAYLAATLTAREELVGKPLFQVFPDDPDAAPSSGVKNLRVSLERVVRDGTIDRMAVQRYSIRRPADAGGGFEERFWSPTNSPIRSRDGELVYLVHYVEDVTEIVRLNELLASDRGAISALEDAATVHEAKLAHEIEAHSAAVQLMTKLQTRIDFEQQLIGIVSHDLRNPLAVIALGASALAAREGIDGRTAQIVLRIQSATHRATRLVRDLLDFTIARLSGSIPIERHTGDFHAIVRAAVAELEAGHPGRVVELSDRGDGRGDWDPERVAQIVQNLLSNALRYSPPHTRVEVATNAGDGCVALAVHNEGEAIPESKLSKIFEPLERAGHARDHESRSVGLGLFIVKKLVDAHGGTIEVRSGPHEGTTFTVKLPRSHPW